MESKLESKFLKCTQSGRDSKISIISVESFDLLLRLAHDGGLDSKLDWSIFYCHELDFTLVKSQQSNFSESSLSSL